MMDDLAIKLFPKEVCAMPEVLLTNLHLQKPANSTENWTTRFGDGKMARSAEISPNSNCQ